MMEFKVGLYILSCIIIRKQLAFLRPFIILVLFDTLASRLFEHIDQHDQEEDSEMLGFAADLERGTAYHIPRTDLLQGGLNSQYLDCTEHGP